MLRTERYVQRSSGNRKRQRNLETVLHLSQLSCHVLHLLQRPLQQMSVVIFVPKEATMDLVQQISVSAVRSKDIGGEIVPKLSKLPVVSSETEKNDKYYLDNLTLDSKLYEYENKSFKNRCSVKGLQIAITGKLTEKFNSKYFIPGTSGVDAFAFNWKSENNWLVPPINLIYSALADGKKFAMEKNNTLSELGSKLPELILGSKADNTRKKYNYGFKAWCKWCKNFNGVKTMPASYNHVCLCIISLLQTKCSVAKLDEVVYSLTWAHEIAEFKNPCKSLLVKSVVQGAKRQLCCPCMKKDIITPEILKNLVLKFGTTFSLYDKRLVHCV
ncbi:unnamed protein product [Mytilus coruscus]|uniref:Uncharacterized protein n=1 Tax=Mytilus coruscus TaxID=42192 RepID=A0A6J8CNK8_MYTCO|nr:unnamed protein product [Mytilus coruscus]